ncbi:MAG: CbtA family protein [Aestuariivirga sp.]|uniref:CbtA family protein n=1 Tax=Aestuariivirga sp. TaxID=2650926 RepID=UPI0038D0405F
MIGRVVLAALLAGMAAGLIMGAILHVRLTPLILKAEGFEARQSVATHDHGNGGAHEHDGWRPADGWQRSLATTLTTVMTGAAFAAVLAGISLLSGIAITRRNGMVWGLCGFLAVTIAPAAGLPPVLPGMAAGDLWLQQLWWVSTVALTAAGIFLLVSRRQAWAVALALALIALPHALGAPSGIHAESTVPAELAARFAANTIAANAVFWLLIGQFLAVALTLTARDIYES